MEELQEQILNAIFYVYIYLDPRKPGVYKFGEYEFDHEPFYIGKGKGRRWLEHLTEAYRELNNINMKSNKHKCRKIRKIKELTGNDPIIIKVKENIIEKEAHNLEFKLIKLIGRSDLKQGSLVNLTNGGDGNSGYIYSDKQKCQMSLRTYEIQNRPEVKLRRSIQSKLMWENPEYRLQQSKANKEIQNRAEVKLSKSIKQKENWLNPEYRKTHIASQIIAQNNPILKKYRSQLMINMHNNIDYSTSRKDNMNTPEHKEKMRKLSLELWKNPEYYEHACKIQKIAQNRPEVNIKRSASLKLTFSNPQIRQHLKKINMGNTYGCKEWVIVDPSGKQYETNQLPEFCKDHNLNSNKMYHTWNDGSYTEGWFCYKTGKYEVWKERNRLYMESKEQYEKVGKFKSINLYTWILINSNNEEFEVPNLKEFCDEYKLNIYYIRKVWRGEYDNFNGWICYRKGQYEIFKERHDSYCKKERIKL